MQPRARVRGTWSSTQSALQESHGGQIRDAHPCKKRKDGAASSCGHPWSRRAWVGQPPVDALCSQGEYLPVVTKLTVGKAHFSKTARSGAPPGCCVGIKVKRTGVILRGRSGPPAHYCNVTKTWIAPFPFVSGSSALPTIAPAIRFRSVPFIA